MTKTLCKRILKRQTTAQTTTQGPVFTLWLLEGPKTSSFNKHYVLYSEVCHLYLQTHWKGRTGGTGTDRGANERTHRVCDHRSFAFSFLIKNLTSSCCADARTQQQDPKRVRRLWRRHSNKMPSFIIMQCYKLNSWKYNTTHCSPSPNLTFGFAVTIVMEYSSFPLLKNVDWGILWPFYLLENPPLEAIWVIYEPTQVNGQLHLRCSARQMGREYS